MGLIIGLAGGQAVRRADSLTDGQTRGRMGRRTADGWTDRRTDGWDGQKEGTDGSTDKKTHGQLDGWTDTDRQD